MLGAARLAGTYWPVRELCGRPPFDRASGKQTDKGARHAGINQTERIKTNKKNPYIFNNRSACVRRNRFHRLRRRLQKREQREQSSTSASIILSVVHYKRRKFSYGSQRTTVRQHIRRSGDHARGLFF